jgi:hypothetical protein
VGTHFPRAAKSELMFKVQLQQRLRAAANLVG